MSNKILEIQKADADRIVGFAVKHGAVLDVKEYSTFKRILINDVNQPYAIKRYSDKVTIQPFNGGVNNVQLTRCNKIKLNFPKGYNAK